MCSNSQWLGFAPSSDKQIINGSAPFVYNYMPHDNQSCITAKFMYNTAHSEMYSPNSIVRSHPASNLIQSSMLKVHESTIDKVCTPSFQIDPVIDYNSLGIPTPSFSFS
jgi:hypothetical protein